MSAVRALRQVSSGFSGLARSVATRRAVACGSIPCTSVSRTWTVQGVPSIRAFSSTQRAFGGGASDAALSQKLQSEIQYEKEALVDVKETPEFLKAFQEQGVWRIEDTAGNDEITLHRTCCNETIRVMFSIADIQTDEEFSPDHEDGSEPAVRDLHDYPVRVALSLTKAEGAGALNVDMVAQDGHFMIDNISYYPDGRLGTELTAEADWKRRGLYIGPQFDTLDATVQEEFEKYLQERGINESLALFIPEYAEYKEQQEYIRWLSNVKTFIDL
ncbi:Mitochondrial glycoprotein [Amanita muscaria]